MQLLPACTTSLRFLIFVGACSAACTAYSQELLRNGDFEGGRLPPWNITQSVTGAIVLDSENSPFTPGGKGSLRITDNDGEVANAEAPAISQSFAPQSGVVFAFDFKVIGGEDVSPWYVAWQGDDHTTAFFFSLGGIDGTAIGFNQERIADLKTNTWYHIEGWANAPQQTLRGTLTTAGSAPVTFQGGFPFGVKSTINAVEISDGDEGRNAPVLLDNFSAKPISLQIARNVNGESVVTWPLADFRLQTSTDLFGTNWVDVSSAPGAYTNTFAGQIRFFRVVH